jgi:ATP synthase protein I
MPETDKVTGSEAERLETLRRKLAKAREEQAGSAPSASDAGDGGAPIGRALRLGTEMAAALIVSLAMGWGLDRWLGTQPIMVIVFFFLGIAAGVLNVFRTINGAGYAVGYKRDGGDAGDKN